MPNPEMEVPDDALAMGGRTRARASRRVKEQQAWIGATQFGQVDLSYRVGDQAESVVYCNESVHHRLRAEGERAPAERDSKSCRSRTPLK